MNTGPPSKEQVDLLWRKARNAGIARRRFLALVAGSGAAAVLAACTPRISPTEGPTSPRSPASAATSVPAQLIQKPIPPEFFYPLGSNAEMRFEVMANRAYAVPNSLFFVRNHTWTPDVDVKTWRLSVEGDGVSKPIQFTYDDLLRLPARTVTRYVECAGNGRSFYAGLLNRPALGGQWHLGAYGIAEWTGVPLAELLERAGIGTSAVDVMPTGLDSSHVERPMSVAKAMQDDTIVAYMMNGDILPRDHGFPARIIAPGWVGINSVKWVGKVTVSRTPLYVEKNTISYVLVGPDYTPQPPAKGPVLADNVMKSACCLPWPATLRAGDQKVVGYAWSPAGRIDRVDVSLDGGSTFRAAELVGPNVERAGTRWEFSFKASVGSMTITPRAVDEKGNIQYDISRQKWNEQGYVFGALVPHPVTVTA